MPDYAGPLQRLALSRTLWLVVAWPLLGFAWQVLVARRRMARARGAEATRRALASARYAGLGCVALATASTLAHTVVIAKAPRGALALFEPVSHGIRLGQFDGAIDLFFDPLSATFCALACLVALGASAFLAARPFADPGWRAWAWMQLSLAGALVTFATDGFVGMAIGWAISGAAAAWLAGWDDSRAGTVSVMRSGVAIGAMVLGCVLLFWGLGGSWDGDDYAPNPPPRFAAVWVGGWPSGSVTIEGDGASGVPSHSGASLTFTGAPGSTVFIDDSRAPSGQSPFVDIPVRSGAHALRIHTGDGSNDDVLARVGFEDGSEVALLPVGPTLAFQAVADQLVLRDGSGNTPVRNALQTRNGPGGIAVVAASLVAFLTAAALMNGTTRPGLDQDAEQDQTYRPRGPPLALPALARGATTAALGPYLLLRVAFLFPLAQGTWIAIEAVGATILLVGGWRAPTATGIRRWLVFVGAVPAGPAYLALASAGVRAATCVFVLSGAATATLYLAAARIGRTPEPGEGAPAALDDLLLVRAPMLLGELLVRMDRWVVGSSAGSIAAVARAGAWLTATIDEHVVGAPATLVAAKLVRAARGVEPLVGMTLGRVAWALLGTVALAVLAHTFWLGR